MIYETSYINDRIISSIDDSAIDGARMKNGDVNECLTASAEDLRRQVRRAWREMTKNSELLTSVHRVPTPERSYRRWRNLTWQLSGSVAYFCLVSQWQVHRRIYSRLHCQILVPIRTRDAGNRSTHCSWFRTVGDGAGESRLSSSVLFEAAVYPRVIIRFLAFESMKDLNNSLEFDRPTDRNETISNHRFTWQTKMAQSKHPLMRR